MSDGHRSSSILPHPSPPPSLPPCTIIFTYDRARSCAGLLSLLPPPSLVLLPYLLPSLPSLPSQPRFRYFRRQLAKVASLQGDVMQRFLFHMIAAVDARVDGSAMTRWREPLSVNFEVSGWVVLHHWWVEGTIF